MKIVVIGGTGLIGSKLVSKLAEDGHDAIAASPESGVNTLTGEGLAAALEGASVVVDVSNSPSFEDEAVMEFFTTSTATCWPRRPPRASGIRLEEFIRLGLSARGDPRTVVGDPEARYFGAELHERTLLPGDDARQSEIRFRDWLAEPATAGFGGRSSRWPR